MKTKGKRDGGMLWWVSGSLGLWEGLLLFHELGQLISDFQYLEPLSSKYGCIEQHEKSRLKERGEEELQQ